MICDGTARGRTRADASPCSMHAELHSDIWHPIRRSLTCSARPKSKAQCRYGQRDEHDTLSPSSATDFQCLITYQVTSL
jgi:hypothetical protein